MKSYTTYITEDKKHMIKRLKGLSADEKETLIRLFKDKPHLENMIDWNNKRLVFTDFNDVMMARSKRDKKRSVKAKGIAGLKDGVDYLSMNISAGMKGYIPLTHEASVLIASKSIGGCVGKWCTAYTKDDSHWIDYMIDGEMVPIYLVGGMDADGYPTKHAIVTTLDGKWEMFDAMDKKVKDLGWGSVLDIDRQVIGKNKAIIKRGHEMIMKYAEEEM